MQNAIKIFLFSAALTVFMLFLVRIRLRMLATDYFLEHRSRDLEELKRDKRKLVRVLTENAIGWGLIISGVVMWVLPGPGWASVVAGLTLADFPGKRSFERWIAKREKLFRGINCIRCRRWRWWQGEDLEPFEAP